MGEEAKKEETPKEEKKEEKTEEKKEAKPPSPVVLFVDLHCVGCAKKIQKYILRIKGVEEVAMDIVKNEVRIKGVVEPQALCNRVMRKTKRRAKVISPVQETEGGSVPEAVASPESGLNNTVDLIVNMHCEACAQQLKRKILKMKGVIAAETVLSSSKVTVTGTVDTEDLVDYVYRHTGKHAEIVPPPSAPEKPTAEEKPKPEEKKEKDGKKDESQAVVEKKDQEDGKKDEAKPEEKKGGNGGGDKAAAEQGGEEGKNSENVEQSVHKMVYYNNNNYYQPLYMMDRIPAPQLFSDENPNACCIV